MSSESLSDFLRPQIHWEPESTTPAPTSIFSKCYHFILSFPVSIIWNLTPFSHLLGFLFRKPVFWKILSQLRLSEYKLDTTWSSGKVINILRHDNGLLFMERNVLDEATSGGAVPWSLQLSWHSQNRLSKKHHSDPHLCILINNSEASSLMLYLL